MHSIRKILRLRAIVAGQHYSQAGHCDVSGCLTWQQLIPLPRSLTRSPTRKTVIIQIPSGRKWRSGQQSIFIIPRRAFRLCPFSPSAPKHPIRPSGEKIPTYASNIKTHIALSLTPSSIHSPAIAHDAHPPASHPWPSTLNPLPRPRLVPPAATIATPPTVSMPPPIPSRPLPRAAPPAGPQLPSPGSAPDSTRCLASRAIRRDH
jgi:hypothetical protein